MEIRWKLLTALVLLTAQAEAKTLLCIPEAAAAVRQQGETFKSGPLDTQTKFIQTNESGKWIVRMHPNGAALFQNCETELFCDSGDTFGGAFMRTPAGGGRSTFTAFWMTVGDTSAFANAAKGYCTEL